MTDRCAKYELAGRRDGRDIRDQVRPMMPVLRRDLGRALGIPESPAIAHTIANYRQRLDALPSLTVYPELRGMPDCINAYNRGLAAEAQLCLTDAIVLANYRHMLHEAQKRSTAVSTMPQTGTGCTVVFFPRSNRGPLVANNNDGTIAHIHQQQPPWIVSNRAGVITATVSSGIFGDEHSPEQFPVPVFLLVSEICGTTDEAVELFTRLNYFWGPCNLLVADRAGRSTVIEKSSCRLALRPSDDGFACTTEMAAEDPEFAQYLWETRRRSLLDRQLDETSPDWAYWQAAEKRSHRLMELVDEARSLPTFAGMERIIYDHINSPEQIHMDGSKCHPNQHEGEWSLRTTIWVVDEHSAQFSFAQPPLSGHLTARQWMRYEAIDYVF